MKNTACIALLILVASFGFLTGCATSRQADLPTSQETDARRHSEINLPVAATETVAMDTDKSAPTNNDFDLNDDLNSNDDWADDDWGLNDDWTDDFYSVPDPLEPFNRAMFVLNDRLYFWVLKPTAQGYRTVVPQPARSGIRNFFNNLGAPIRIVNNILQGKGEAAEAEVAKFLYNSTIGILGFGNPARGNPGLNPANVDMGQTLGRYGIGDGLYLVWPVLGPSTLRDSFGIFGDYWLRPMTYMHPWEVSWGLSGLNTINDVSFRIGDYEAVMDAAIDPYQAFRDGYIQMRRARIQN